MSQKVSTNTTDELIEVVEPMIASEMESIDTTTKSLVKKLTSRKFLMAFVPAVAAIAALFGYSENYVVTIASAAVIVISSLGYMYTEGKCDQESIKASADALLEMIDNLTKINADLSQKNEELVSALSEYQSAPEAPEEGSVVDME